MKARATPNPEIKPERNTFRLDVIAGLTAAAVVLPKAVNVGRRSGLAERLGRERLLFNARTAIERFKEMREART